MKTDKTPEVWVRNYFAETWQLDNIPLDFKLRESLDSLDLVEFIMELEAVWQIELPDGDAEKIFTVADVVAYIERKRAKC